MHSNRIRLIALSAAAVLLASCGSSPIQIIDPVLGLTNKVVSGGIIHEPVTQIRVSFTVDFKPAETWDITLDGTPLSGFSPAPAPGVTSTAPLVFEHGTGLRGSFFTQHTIKTSATCGFFCVYADETVTFSPPQLFYNGTDAPLPGDVKQFVPTPESVDVQFDRSVPIVVTIRESSATPIMKLGLSLGTLLPVGTLITVTIPANSTKAEFFIVGDSLGLYTLEFKAPGATPGIGSGKVSL